MQINQTNTSFGTNITNTYTTQSPNNRFRFSQKISFFDEGTLTSTRARELQGTREQLKDLIYSSQDRCTFIEYQEFQALAPGEVAISILSHYNQTFQSTSYEQSQDEFNAKIDNLVDATRRRKTQADKDKSGTQLHIQIYVQPTLISDRIQLVLYQTGRFEAPSLNPKLLLDCIWLFLRKFQLTVQVDCVEKNVQTLGSVLGEQNSKLLEGLKVTVRQKEVDNKQCLSPMKQVIIRTTQQQGKIQPDQGGTKIELLKTNENLNTERQVRVYFSPNKTQNWMTATNVSQEDVIHKNYKSSGKKLIQKADPVKLFAQSACTSYLEKANFAQLVQQINNYEIEVGGERIKTARTQISIDTLLSQASTDAELIVSVRVERTDINKCLLRIRKDQIPVTDVCIKVSKDTSFPDQYEIVDQYDSIAQAFYFWAGLNVTYRIQVSKKDCFPLEKDVFIQGCSNAYVIDFELVGCVQTQLWFKAFDITDQACKPLNDVNIMIEQQDFQESKNDTFTGITNTDGLLSFNGFMFKQLQVQAKRPGYLGINYDFDVRSNSTGSIQLIPMIPDYYSLINQYHILVYIPRKRDNQLDFLLKCPGKVGCLTGGAVWKVVKFLSSCIKLRSFCQIEYILTDCTKLTIQTINALRLSKKPNETFLKTRVSLKGEFISPQRKDKDNEIVAQKIIHYCAEESIRVFITFGHEVINTFMIQSYILNTSAEKCYGQIDCNNFNYQIEQQKKQVDKRKFIQNDDKLNNQECNKSLKNLKIKSQSKLNQNLDSQHTSSDFRQILSLITNQSLKIK